MPVFANVRAVLEHPVHRLHTEGVTPRRTQTGLVELVTDGLHGFSFGVLREHQLHERRGIGVYDVLALLVHLLRLEAEHLMAIEVRVLGVEVHPALDMHGQVPAVILRQGLHQPLDEYSLRGIRRNVLR